MFSINFNDIVNKFLPIRVNKQRNRELLYTMLKPLQTLNEAFVIFRNAINYKLLFNAQVIYLEHFLNDRYDSVNSGIYIQDAANVNYAYLYNKIENRQATVLYNKSENKPKFYMYNKSEYLSQVDFIVMVPGTVSFNQLEMKTAILFYNLAGKRFKIQTY